MKFSGGYLVLALLCTAGSARAQSGDTASVAQDLAALKRQVAEQQAQIDKLRAVLDQQQALLNRLQVGQASAPASTEPRQKPGAAFAPPTEPRQKSAAAGEMERFPAAVPNATANQPNGAPGASAAQGKPATSEQPPAAPLSFRIGASEFTPGGFMDFTSIYRSTNVGSGIGTSFGAIPFNNAVAGRLSENRLTMQNSRLALRVTSTVGKQKITGYVEADFLGAQPANAFVTSNSNSFRSRLYWVQIQRNKWEVLAGQSWSMMTPGRKGISPNPSDLFYSQNVDTNYQVGLTWSRQAQFRVVYHPNSRWAAGVSFENPQQYVGGGVILPAFAVSQFDNGSNTGTPNLHPDVVAKVAYDRAGNRVHIEAAGLLRSFKLFNPADGRHNTAVGAGGSLNAIVEAGRNLRLVATTYYSDGGGRYIFGLGPDLIVRPNGQISLVRAASGIAGFEYQATPKTMYYGYYGGANFKRNFSAGGTGFGVPGVFMNAANRTIQEPTFGVLQTFWKEAKYGAVQLLTQYSYVVRHPFGVDASTRIAHTHMVYLNLRYVLP